VADQLVVASVLSPTVGSTGEIRVIDASGLAATYPVSTSASSTLSLSGLVPAGDGSLWLEVVPTAPCETGCPPQLQFGSQTWTDTTGSEYPEYLVNFLP
jgi:hypothetical protein